LLRAGAFDGLPVVFFPITSEYLYFALRVCATVGSDSIPLHRKRKGMFVSFAPVRPGRAGDFQWRAFRFLMKFFDGLH